MVERSGRKVFRVWFDDAPDEVIARCLDDLRGMGALTERSSRKMHAVDAENDVLAQRVADYLWKGQQEGKWIYEPGQTK